MIDFREESHRESEDVACIVNISSDTTAHSPKC